MDVAVSEIFDPSAWTQVAGFDFTDITYHRANEVAAVRIAFNRTAETLREAERRITA